MDSSYCAMLAKDKLDFATTSPFRYVFNDIGNFFKLSFSSKFYHSVPTIVFVISVILGLQNMVDSMFVVMQRFITIKHRYVFYVLKTGMIILPLIPAFCTWFCIQELVYCTAWFLTSEKLHPDLLEKWWFSRNNETSGRVANIQNFFEVLPPEIMSWLIMASFASVFLVVCVNSSTDPVKNVVFQNRICTPFQEDEYPANVFNHDIKKSSQLGAGSSDSEPDVGHWFREQILDTTPHKDIPVDPSTDYQEENRLGFSLLQPLRPPSQKAFY